MATPHVVLLRRLLWTDQDVLIEQRVVTSYPHLVQAAQPQPPSTAQRGWAGVPAKQSVLSNTQPGNHQTIELRLVCLSLAGIRDMRAPQLDEAINR